VVKSRLNEKLLKDIASATDGGFYTPLIGANTIDMLYEKGLAPLPKSETQGKLVRQYNEKFHWPLGAAIVLLLFEMLLPERKRERKGDAGRTQVANEDHPFVTSDTMAIGLTIALLALPASAMSTPSSALKNYNAGHFELALKEYQQALEKQKDDPRLSFNAGTVAYRLTNYTAAAQYFSTALAAPDVKLQQAAYYNLGNTQFRMGYASEDLDALLAQWGTATNSFQSAVKLDKNDRDAAQNLAFVKTAIEQVIAMREAARRAREEADQSLRRRNYHRALEIMEALVQQNIAAKPFEEFTKKLKSIDEIANPPAAPAQP
jgi:Ca-activated chloride channel family protein